FHQFAQTLLPWLGVSELEKAMTISINPPHSAATLENTENVTTDAIQALQQEVAEVPQTTIQNHLALEYLLATLGGICMLANTTYCVYVKQDL
ncbi:ERVV2 protein, partial [Bucco capensis]|nr:ERVV2 protein [Bucco capensis]